MSKMRSQDSGKYEIHFILFSSVLINKQPSPTTVTADRLLLEPDDYTAIQFAEETFFIWVGCTQLRMDVIPTR